MKICDARFKYTPSLRTDIAATWKRFGFKPTTEAERLARHRRLYEQDKVVTSGASVTKFDLAKRKVRGGLPPVGETKTFASE